MRPIQAATIRTGASNAARHDARGGPAVRVLVTGGAGFIGSQYVRMLLAGDLPATEHAQVTVVDKLTYAGNLANLEPVSGSDDLTFVKGDICDAGLMAAVVPGHDAVVNFAAESHVDRSIAAARAFVEANVMGVQTLLDACLGAGVKRVIQVSTDEVYGSLSHGSWAEDATMEPNSPYAASKAGGDMLARAYAHTHGLDVRVTRCCNNYGPYQFPEKIIPLFVTNLLDGMRVPVYGDGKNVRSWIHVADHCRGIQLVLERGAPGGVYHIAGDSELTNLELTQAILDCCEAGWDMVDYVQDRKGHDRRYSLDDSLLRGLGYAPRIAFAEGLTATMHWYRRNRGWWEPLKRAATAAHSSAAAPGGRAPRDHDGHRS
jgi:dTDP-glucose 4,6-dehydratase